MKNRRKSSTGVEGSCDLGPVDSVKALMVMGSSWEDQEMSSILRTNTGDMCVSV